MALMLSLHQGDVLLSTMHSAFIQSFAIFSGLNPVPSCVTMHQSVLCGNMSRIVIKTIKMCNAIYTIVQLNNVSTETFCFNVLHIY